MAKADHADAHKRLPLLSEDELSAVVTHRNPPDKLRRGINPRAQLFGSAAAGLRYNCVLRAIAFFSCRISKIPYDFAIVAPSWLVSLALVASTGLNDALFVGLRERKSDAGSPLEFLGLAASFRDHGGGAIAVLVLSETEIQRPVEFAEETFDQGSAPVATLRKLAGKLRLAQTAIMERFARAALQPAYDLIAKGGRTIPQSVRYRLRRQAFVLLAIAPRFITSPRTADAADPVRFYSGATGAGMLASISLFSRDEESQPILLAAQADQTLRGVAASANKMYIHELLAVVATVRQRRDRVWRGGVSLFLGSEAACAASTRGAAGNIMALMLIFRCGR